MTKVRAAIILLGLSIGLLIFSIDSYIKSEAGSATTPTSPPQAVLISSPQITELPPPEPALPPEPSVFEPFFIHAPEAKAQPVIDIHTDLYPLNALHVSHGEFDISEELRAEFDSKIRNYPRRVAFYVLTLDETMSFGYNPDALFPTASTIKAPYALYCYKQIAEGNVSLSDTKIYESRHFRDGSGVMQKHPIGGEYTIEQLLYYTLFYSDNTAYYMCIDHFKREGYNEMLEELQTRNLYLRGGRNWSETTPRDSVIVWRAIYDFTGTCSEGGIFFDVLRNATANLLDGALPQYSTLHKSGWTTAEYHDAGIVFSEIPYYITIMTNGSTNDRTFVRDMIRLIDRAVKEYNEFLTLGD